MKEFKQEIVQVGDILIIDGINYRVDCCIEGEDMEVFLINLKTGKRNRRMLKGYKFPKATYQKAA
jgi:hypothetical protein